MTSLFRGLFILYSVNLKLILMAMNKIAKNEKGFRAVELIMVIVIIGLLGAVGYLVYRNHNQPTKVVTVTKTITTNPTNSINKIKIGETFNINLNGTYWAYLSIANPNVVTELSHTGISCNTEFGCKSSVYTLKAISKGTTVITDSRDQCGEAKACQGNDGKFSTTITVN
jgi:Tfp pilus assembly major pilin PilA